MASNTSTLSFPNWTPPAINTLDFGSNCTTVKSFLKTWFDISAYEDVGNMTGNDQNVTFWVPETLQSEATERYFRQALPSNLRAAATYGEIIEWEMSLRNAYAQGVQEWVDLAVELDHTDSLPLDIEYFKHVIDGPSRRCQEEVCELSYEWGEMGDVNGPGVFINYILLLVISGFYSVVASLQALLQLRPKRKEKGPPGYDPAGQPHQAARARPSVYLHLYRVTRQSFTGFADAAAIFSIALSGAILTHHLKKDSILVNSKDFILQLWACLFTTCLSVWLFRIGACFRRVDRAELERATGIHQRRSKKKTLLTGAVLFLSVPSFAATVSFLIIARTKMPYKSDDFWDDVCDNDQIITKRFVIIGTGVLAGYCAIRTFLSVVVLRCLGKGEKKQILLPNGPPVSQKERAHRSRGIIKLYSRIKNVDPRYRRWMDRLGLLDLLFLGAWSAYILVYFHLFRKNLSNRTNVKLFADNWTLGQVLSLSTTFPVVLSFLHDLCKSAYFNYMEI